MTSLPAPPISGPIPARVDGRGRTEDRRAVGLGSAWLLRDRTSERRSSPVFAHDSATVVPMSAVPDGPLLVILSDAVPAVAASASAALRAGRRVYGLAPDGWASGGPPEWLHGTPSTRLLVRRLRDLPVAAVLGSRTGWLWMGSGGPGAWRLTLSAEQAEAARTVFLQLYWNEADDEGWPTGDGMLWRPRGEAPFDVPAAHPDAVVRLEHGQARLPVPDRGSWLYAPGGDVPDGVADRLWRQPSGGRHGELAALVEGGTTVLWTDLDLPTCMVSTLATAIPSTTRWSLRVVLTREQAIALAEVLGQQPTATFHPAVDLGTAATDIGSAGRVWRAGRAEPEALVDREDLDAGVVLAASLREAVAAEPSSWPEPAPLALAAHWTWQVGTPQLPEGAADDPLVKAWRAIDANHASRVDTALATLADIERSEDVLRQTFAALKGALLGFGRAREGIGADLAPCADVVPSTVGPDAAREHLRRVAELEARVARLGDEVAEAERTARAEAERERQEKEHAAAQVQAQQDLAIHEGELRAQQQALAVAETKLGDLQAQKGTMSNKDYRARGAKLRDDQSRALKQVRRLESLIEQAKAVIDAPFEPKPSNHATSGRRGATSFVPPVGKPGEEGERQVPHEALPAVGHLFRYGQDRLLAIGRWEDLNQGEAEAARLGARLVATREG